MAYLPNYAGYTPLEGMPNWFYNASAPAGKQYFNPFINQAPGEGGTPTEPTPYLYDTSQYTGYGGKTIGTVDSGPQGFDIYGNMVGQTNNPTWMAAAGNPNSPYPAFPYTPGGPMSYSGKGQYLGTDPRGINQSYDTTPHDGSLLGQLQGLAIPGLAFGIGALNGGLGLGGAASSAAGSSGGSMFNLFDPSTWGSIFSGGSGPVDLSSLASSAVAPDGSLVSGGTALGSGAMDAGSYNSFLQSIGIDPSSTLFSGGGNMADLTGGALNSGGGFSLPNGTGSLVQSLLGSGNYSGLGGLLGALAGGVGANNKPAGNITTTQDIPDYLKPYQSMNLTSATNNFGASQGGQSLIPGATGFLQGQINGNYLNPQTNPAFNAYANDLAGIAGSQYLSTFGHVGAAPDNLNNSNTAEGFGRGVTAAMLPLANSAMTQGLQNQYNAAANAPGYAGNVANATFSPNIAFKNLYSGPTANTQPYFTNTAGGVLSGALAGSTIGKSLFGA